MRIPKIIKQALDEVIEAKLPYEVRRGGKHLKLYINNRFVGIMPSNGTKDMVGGRGGLNLVAQIRRQVRQGAAR